MTLSVISLLLSVIGLVLTSIEVLYPEVADNIEKKINRFSLYFVLIRELSRLQPEEDEYRPASTTIHSHDNNGTGFGYEDRGGWEYALRPKKPVFETVVLTTFGGLLSILFVFITMNMKWNILVALFFPFLTAFSICFLYAPEILSFINEKTNGKALGTIGLGIAFLGVVADVYDLLLAF